MQKTPTQNSAPAVTRPAIPVFCAIDTTDLDREAELARAAIAAGCGIKLGKEFFTANGPRDVRRIVPEGTALFLDLKFHDIPNTVAAAIRAASASMRPFMLTVHAAGGAAMLRAAADAAAEAAQPPLILGVTVLTSLDASDLAAIGVPGDVASQVKRLANLARQNNVRGLVCAASEIAMLRATFGNEMKLVVPGIRPAGGDVGDQKRVMTPVDALKLGADFLVIGRPITAAADPAQAAQAIADDIKAAA